MNIENGTRVRAIRHGNGFKKHEAGVLTRQGGIDSENYFFVALDSGKSIGPSLDDYWEKEPTQLSFRYHVALAEAYSPNTMFGMSPQHTTEQLEISKKLVAEIPRYEQDLTQEQKDYLVKWDTQNPDHSAIVKHQHRVILSFLMEQAPLFGLAEMNEEIKEEARRLTEFGVPLYKKDLSEDQKKYLADWDEFLKFKKKERSGN